MIRYREATTPADMERVIDVEIATWGVTDRDVFPPHLLLIAQAQGGVVFIAEEDDQVLGFCFALPARRGDAFVLWSYIAGVHPGVQGRGIGFELKRIQREWAEAQGYHAIHWTFDPLQTRNANFNLNRLGVTAVAYHQNFYGEMTDAINHLPLPTDRLEVVWRLDSSNDSYQMAQPRSRQQQFLVTSSNGHPVIADLTDPDPQTELAIVAPQQPTENTAEWQEAIRRAFQHAFSHGYEAYRFVKAADARYYLLRPSG